MMGRTPKIAEIQIEPGYLIHAKFKNEERRVLNMIPYLDKGIFRELRDESYFKKARIVWGGIEWPHEQDLSADTLYYKGTAVKKPVKQPQRTSVHH